MLVVVIGNDDDLECSRIHRIQVPRLRETFVIRSEIATMISIFLQDLYIIAHAS
jgi:hypothetical protein